MNCWLSIMLVLGGCACVVPCSILHVPCLSLTLYTSPWPMQDRLWGTPITDSNGTKALFTTSCSRGYCRCQPWHVDNRRECRFTVSQDLGQRDQQCTHNRQGNKGFLYRQNQTFAIILHIIFIIVMMNHLQHYVYIIIIISTLF